MWKWGNGIWGSRLLAALFIALTPTAFGFELLLRDLERQPLARFQFDPSDQADPFVKILLQFPQGTEAKAPEQSHLVIAGFLWSRATDPHPAKDAVLAQMAALDSALNRLKYIHYQPEGSGLLHWSRHPVNRLMDAGELGEFVVEVVQAGLEFSEPIPAVSYYLLNFGARSGASWLGKSTTPRAGAPILNSQVDHALFGNLIIELYAYALADRIQIPDPLRSQIHLAQIDRLADLLLSVSRQLDGLRLAPGGVVLRKNLGEDIVSTALSLGISAELLPEVCRAAETLGHPRALEKEELRRTVAFFEEIGRDLDSPLPISPAMRSIRRSPRRNTFSLSR